CLFSLYFFFSSRRRHTRSKRDWSSDVCSSDLAFFDGSRKYVSAGRENGTFAVWRNIEVGDVLVDAGPVLQRLLMLAGQRDAELRSEERRVGKEWRSWWWADE